MVGPDVADMQLARYPSKYLQQLEELLDRADAAADSDRARNFLVMTREQFNFNKLLTVALLTHLAWQLDASDAKWAQLRDAVAAFDAFRLRMIDYPDDFADQWFPGHGNFCNYLTSGATNQAYYSSWRSRRDQVKAAPIRGTVIGYGGNAVRRPLTFDFDHPPRLGEMPVARATSAPTIDGKLDDQAWQAAAPQMLSTMQAQQSDIPTAVRVLYDDDNLYIAFACDEPLIDKLVARSTGRDGPIWTMDCGEILLAPDRSRRRFYHAIIAPADDAIYDDRTGFRTLDDQDDSWNGEWSYAWSVDGNSKRWSIEVKVPFAMLGVEPPKAGDWWLGNFGRERAAAKANPHAEPELFLWSQEESMGFVDPAAFGRLRFVE